MGGIERARDDWWDILQPNVHLITAEQKQRQNKTNTKKERKKREKRKGDDK